MENNEKTSLCQTTPISFIERYCSKLGMSSKLTKVCKFVAIRIQRNNLIPENTPHSIAAGIVFIYGGITLPYDIMIYAGALLIAAELLGVAEEMV